MRGLTGSVDRASPWQRCVDVDGSQKTLTNKATELNTPFFAVRPLGEPERKKYIAKRMQENEKKRVREIKERCVVSVLCVFVLEMIQRWKEDVVLPPTVIFCCAGTSNQKCFPLFFFFYFIRHASWLHIGTQETIRSWQSFFFFTRLLCCYYWIYFVEGKRWRERKKKNLHFFIQNVLLFCYIVCFIQQLLFILFTLFFFICFWKVVEKCQMNVKQLVSV